MPISVECSICGKKYRVPDEKAGRSISCKDCGGEIDVPGGRRRAKDDDDDDDVPVRRKSTKKKKRSEEGNSSGLLIAGGIGAAVLVVGIGVFFAMRGKPDAGNPIANNPVQPAPVPGTQPAVPGNAHEGANPAATNPVAPAPVNPNPQPNVPVNPNPQVAANPGIVPPANNANTKAAGSGFKGGLDQGGIGGGFEMKPLVNWKAQPDPMEALVTYDTSKKFNVPIKGGFIGDDSVVYPVTPSPFGLFGDDNGKGGREIWNFATGQKVGVMKERLSNKVAISPDGKYIAWFRFDNGGGIEVYDIKTKKSLGAVSVDSSKLNISVLALPSSERMVAFSDVHTALVSWKLPSGDLEREVSLGKNGRPGDIYSFSPGGRYAAYLSEFLARTISIYDFKNGENVGTIEFAKRPSNDLLAVAFSHNGEELALLFDGAHPNYGERIFILKTATGAVIDTIVLEEGVKKEHNLHGKGTGLQWFPNGQQFLLHGIAIVDRTAKKVVYSLGKPKLDTGSLKNRRVLDNGFLAVWEGTRQDSSVKPLLIKSEDISKSVEAMEAGGLIVDAKLPKLTKFDASQATDRSSDAATGWQVSVDPAPAASGPLLKAPLGLKGTGQARQLAVSSQNPGLGFVRFAEGEDAADLKNRIPEYRFRATKALSIVSRPRLKPIHCQKNWIEVYDLAKGDSKSRIEVDFSCDLITASSDGKRVLVSAHDGQGRVDVYSVDDGKHIAGCRPFQEEDKDENRSIETAFFVGSDHVGTINFEDRLIVWKLPECTPVYEIKEVVSAAMSPGGKSLALAVGKRAELRDPATGAPQGAIELGGPVIALAFHPAGERLAVINEEKKGTYLHEVDIKAGKALDPIPVPMSVQSCHWCGDDYLLLNNSALFDVKQKTVAWTYETPDQNTAHVKSPPDGRHWYLAKSNRGATVQVVAAELPDAAAKAKLGGAKLEPKMLVQPGGSVTVMAQIPERPDRAGFQAEALGLLNKAVTSSGVKDVKGQPVKLAVSMEFKQGGMVPVQFFGGGKQQQVQLQEKTIEITVAYDFNGAALWKTSNRLSNLGIFIRVPSVETAQKALDDDMWDRARGFVGSLQLPAYVFSQESVYGLGTSTLTGDGPQAKAK